MKKGSAHFVRRPFYKRILFNTGTGAVNVEAIRRPCFSAFPWKKGLQLILDHNIFPVVLSAEAADDPF